MADPPPEPGVLKGAIDVSHDGHVWILAVSGEHDLSTAPNLVHDLEAAFGAGYRLSSIWPRLSSWTARSSTRCSRLVSERWRVRTAHSPWSPLLGSFASRVLALVVGTLIPTYPNPTDAAAAVAPAS